MAEAVAAYLAQAAFAAADGVAALGISGASYAIATTVYVAAEVAVPLAIAATASALLAPSTPTPAGQRLTFLQSIPARRIGCGHPRMGGALLLDYASGQNLVQVVAFADCKVGNIDGYWLNQDQVTLSGNQVNTLTNGAYSRVKLYTGFGVTGTTAFSSLHASFPQVWGSNAYGTGVFMGYLNTSNGKIEQFSKDFPRGSQLQYNIAGDVDVHYDWRDGAQSQTDPTTWKNSANPVVVLVHQLWFYRGYDWTTDFLPTLSILTAEANVCDQAVPVLNILSKVSVDAAAGATAVRLRTVAGLTTGQAIIVAGQNFTVSSFGASHVDGQDVNLSGGLSTGVSAGGLARWTSDPTTPATKPRYEAHGCWVVGEPEADTCKRLLECMDGWMARRGSDGAFVIRAGGAYTPTITIGLDEIIDYSWDGFVDLGKITNELIPAYVEPANDYNQIDTTPWRDDTSVSIDGLSSQPFSPGLVQSGSQVRRLAKAKMSRLQKPVQQLTLKASGIRCLGERFLQLPANGIEVAEMNGAVVEVVGDFEIVDSGMHVQFPVQVFDPTCYSWSYITEEGPGPADVAAPVGGVLTAPTITEIDPFFDALSDGTTGVRLRIYTTGPSRDDLTWYYRWRVTGASSWKESSYLSAAGGTVELDSDFVPANSSIDIETSYSTGAGTLSPWSTTTVVSTSTAGVAPTDPTWVSETGGTGSAALVWRNSTSANFDHIILSRAAHGAGFGAATTITTQYGSSGATISYTDTVAAGAYDWWITAYNASATASAHVGPVTATVT